MLFSLDGEWMFTCDRKGEFGIENLDIKAEWRTALVPLSWQAQFEDLRDYQGIAWYKKVVNLPEKNPGENYIIHFGAVDYFAKVFVNGVIAGQNEGGYNPFDIDITGLIIPGENEIVVRVMDPVATPEGTEGISFLHIPHGKQSWYILSSGIWQSVNIAVKPERYIKSVHFFPEMDGNVKAVVALNKAKAEHTPVPLVMRISSPDGKILCIEKEILTPDTEVTIDFKVESPVYWHFNTPNLYNAIFTLCGESSAERFGFRSIESKNKMLYLNGEPFYLLAALDQDFYPDSIYTTPSEAYIRDEMLKAKALGLNMLRCHIKMPDPVYYKVADEVGLLLWVEVPNWEIFTFEAAARGRKTFEDIMQRDWNHPSIIILTIMNESWGIDLQQQVQRDWLKKEYDWAKERVNGRYLIVDNSPCIGNFHVKTDINDYHTYWAIPENRKTFDDLVKDFASRPKWLFSSSGDAEETGQEPLIISEFGNWGLPQLPEQLPWWFNRKYKDVECSLPEDIHTRYAKYKYNDVFGSYVNLAKESQDAQFMSLKYEIESIRLQDAIQGYVITELTDLNWEANGILDIYRNYKTFTTELTDIQQQDIIIPRPVMYSYNPGQQAVINLWISHYSDKVFNNLTMRWSTSTGSCGLLNIPPLIKTEVLQLQPLVFDIEQADEALREKILFELIDEAGTVIAKNFTEIFVYPVDKEKMNINIQVYNPKNSIHNPMSLVVNLAENFYPFEPNPCEVIITKQLDAKISSRLEEGAIVLCFADSNTNLPPDFPLQIKGRDIDWLDGNWASNFNWVKNEQGPFKNLKLLKRFGFETALAAPQHVICNIPADQYQDVLAGMFVGWIHSTCGFIVQMKAGKGILILSTIPLLNNYISDPFSQAMLHNLIKYSVSKECRPSFSWVKDNLPDLEPSLEY